MKKILIRVWKLLTLFWTLLGATISIGILGYWIYVTVADKSPSKISLSDFCSQYKVGGPIKALEVSDRTGKIKNNPFSELSCPLGKVYWDRSFDNSSIRKEARDRAAKILFEIDQQGLDAQFKASGNVFWFQSGTCQIEFEKGKVTSTKYYTY